MAFHIPPLLRLPPEVFGDVVFELAATQPLGPPYAVLPLLKACRATHEMTAPKNNMVLWSRIFRYKFDSGAVARRAFVPTPSQCVDQLVRYCQSLQVIRSANRFRSIQLNTDDPDVDITLDEALMVAVTMMMEDDGRNMRQLEEWAELRQLLWSILKHRVYEDAQENDGWASENKLNSCTMWLMWMMTTEESLKNETPEERDLIRQLILPFMVMPFRYPSAEAPAHHFGLPLVSDGVHVPVLTTIQTVHGEYPVYPAEARMITDVHYASRPNMSIPLIAPAAKLIYFSREEVKKMPSLPHFARDREEWIARGNDPNGVGITRADVDEWNWGWAARLPGGAGRPSVSTWDWGAGNDDLAFARDFSDETTTSMADVERALGITATAPTPAPAPTAAPATTPAPAPTAAPATVASAATASSNATHPRWTGKAPHSIPRGPKSKRWDTDWWRLRLCGNYNRPSSRVRYGRVYEPGSMDGLWHGRMMMPAREYWQSFLLNAQRPQDFGPEATFGRLMVLPLYARFREVHRVIGGGDADVELGSGDPEEENMNNAWFDGEVGTTEFSVRGSEEQHQEVEITVVREGLRRKGTFPCYDNPRRRRRGEGLGKGNEAYEAASSTDAAPVDAGWAPAPAAAPATDDGDEDDFTGYDHDEEACDQCESRRRIARQLQREREQADRDREAREQIFASVGLGRSDPRSPRSSTGSEDSASSSATSSSQYSVETTESLDEYDPSIDEWEVMETDDIVDENGNLLYPALPPTHDRTKLATGRCDGVEDIFLFGETDTRHGQAFKRYRFYGRVRAWDGLIGILRMPIRNPHAPADDPEALQPENFFFYGYLVGGENFVGTWRFGGVDPIAPAWEGPFVMSRRED